MTDKLNVNTVIELNTMEINFFTERLHLHLYLFTLTVLCLNTLFVLGRVTNIHDLCKAQSINRHFCRETFRVLNLAEQSDWLIFLRKNGIVQSRMPATQNRGEGFNVPWLFQYTNLSSHIIYKPFLQKIIS